MSNFVNVFDTGHISDTQHSSIIWKEYVASESLLGGAFEKKYRCYNKDFGRTNILPHERPRFIKDRLNYRKHDLPHAHNPVTDFFVPSFTGFPLPARGLDRDDMSGAISASAGGATFPGGSAINPRKPRDWEHGAYHSVDLSESTKPAKQAMVAQDVPHLQGGSLPPPMYPTRYLKNSSTMQWRQYIGSSGKNNRNMNMTSTYGHTYTPHMKKFRRSMSSTAFL